MQHAFSSNISGTCVWSPVLLSAGLQPLLKIIPVSGKDLYPEASTEKAIFSIYLFLISSKATYL